MNSSTALVVRSSPPEEDGEKMQKELTDDDIVEILARLPIKSLMRFKCVSKLWYLLICSPNFISMHSTHTHNKQEQVTWDHFSYGSLDSNSTVSFDFGDDELTLSVPASHVEMLGCLNGVVCLGLSVPHNKFALWNPATRQSRLIASAMFDDDPDHTRRKLSSFRGDISYSYAPGFGFDPVVNAYKVAQIQLTFRQGQTRAQVNVFSTATNLWTEKTIVVPYPIMGSGFKADHRHRAICVNGHIHWHIVLFHPGPELEDMYILSYNMIDEVFTRIEMPIRPVVADYRFAAYKGSLAVFVHWVVHRRTGGFYMTSPGVDVWVLNDCGGPNQSWSKLMTFKIPCEDSRALGFFRKDDTDLIILYHEYDWYSYLYDPEKGQTKKLGTKQGRWKTFLYSESFASLNYSGTQAACL